MSRKTPAEIPVSIFPSSAAREVLQGLGGVACAGLILLALAFLRAPPPPGPAPEIYAAHLVTLPLETPPPPPPEQTPPPPGPIVGPMRMEVAPEVASAVHIQVPEVPLLDTDPPPPARAVVAARFNLGNAVARPVPNDEPPSRRIFSRDEVDQRPLVVFRLKPKFSDEAITKMATPRVGLLLVVNTDGSVGDVRVMRSSGEPEFDQTVVSAIGEWRFSPAIRKGHKVRCWVEQMVTVKMSGTNPFEAH